MPRDKLPAIDALPPPPCLPSARSAAAQASIDLQLSALFGSLGVKEGKALEEAMKPEFVVPMPRNNIAKPLSVADADMAARLANAAGLPDPTQTNVPPACTATAATVRAAAVELLRPPAAASAVAVHVPKPPTSFSASNGHYFRLQQKRKKAKQLHFLTLSSPTTTVECAVDFELAPELEHVRNLTCRDKIVALQGTYIHPPTLTLTSLEILDESTLPNARILFDLSYEADMDVKEAKSLSRQLTMSVAANNRAALPFHVQFGGKEVLNPTATSPLLVSLGKQNWREWPGCEVMQGDWVDETNPANVVYLCSDSPNILTTIEDDDTFVIGGLVDHTDKPGFAFNRATSLNVRTARLPIDKVCFLRSRQMNETRVGVDVTTLAVVQLLLLYREHKDWGKAISECPSFHSAPLRKYVRWLEPYTHLNEAKEDGGGAKRPGKGFSLI